jgi:hypothetical protein
MKTVIVGSENIVPLITLIFLDNPIDRRMPAMIGRSAQKILLDGAVDKQGCFFLVIEHPKH